MIQLFLRCSIFFCTLASAPAVFAQTGVAGVFFDDFLTDNAGMAQDNVPGSNNGLPPLNAFINWTVTDGSVDLVGGNILGATDPSLGGRFVDLGGSTGDPGLFQTNMPITFLPGVSYTLSFRYLSTEAFLNPANVVTDSATATIGGFTFNVSTNSSAFQAFSQDFTFAAGAAVPLSFQDLGPNDNSGIGIDMVMVNPTVAVPEPASLVVLAGGMAAGAGMLAARRRLKKVRCAARR